MAKGWDEVDKLEYNNCNREKRAAPFVHENRTSCWIEEHIRHDCLFQTQTLMFAVNLPRRWCLQGTVWMVSCQFKKQESGPVLPRKWRKRSTFTKGHGERETRHFCMHNANYILASFYFTVIYNCPLCVNPSAAGSPPDLSFPTQPNLSYLNNNF